MVPDCDTNAVYISDLLAGRHREVAAGLRRFLGPHLRTIPGTRDIWCRDYMPVQIAPDRLVQFRYDPTYLRKYPDLRTENGGALLRLQNCKHSDVVIDGGNVVRWRDAAIMTDRIFSENRSYSERALLRNLRNTLEIDRLMIIPQEPGEEYGHADGIVRFIDGRTVLVNDCSSLDPGYGKELYGRLRRAGLDLIRIPYNPPLKKTRRGDQSAVGVYVNFLQIKDRIVCPEFGTKEDDQARRVLEDVFSKSAVQTIGCEKLAKKGGVLNCATWNIRIT